MFKIAIGILLILFGAFLLIWSIRDGKGKNDFKLILDWDSYGIIQGYLAGIGFIILGILLILRGLS
jgi:hypothetical protein